MDVFRILPGAPARWPRKPDGGLLGALFDAADSAPSAAPVHGGVSGAARTAPDQDSGRRERRRSALAELLALPPGTQVDIVVDAEVEQLTFVVRDVATGRNLRTIPEAEAKALIERFQARHGSFVDRSL
jgi:hypothetical protein